MEIAYNNSLYNIVYNAELSETQYTQKQVYYVYTTEEDYKKAYRDVKEILNDGSISKGLYTIRNKENPCFHNYMQKYHTFSYDEYDNVFIYTLVIPYDD